MRQADVKRDTLETRISVRIDLDGTGKATLATGVPFLDHMLDQIARHGAIDLDVKAEGDVHIDDHHTVEDVGITMGQAFARALGDKKGIRRYASADLPMDGTLTRAAVDVSGRAFLVFRAEFSQGKIGDIDTELFREFFQALAINAGITLHIENFYFDNNHHLAESMFKAVARALREAVEIDPRMSDAVPSTKGTL